MKVIRQPLHCRVITESIVSKPLSAFWQASCWATDA